MDMDMWWIMDMSFIDFSQSPALANIDFTTYQLLPKDADLIDSFPIRFQRPENNRFT